MNASPVILPHLPGRTEWLGRMGYAEALELQEGLLGGIADGREEERLLLLEHPPVFTIGRTRDQSSLRDPSHLPYPVHETNRGGQATWHGPGQLVGYPLLDLRLRGKDLHVYLRQLEEVLIRALSTYGMTAHRRDGLTGVWIAERKIASIGVGVRRWISMHGFALNITGALDGFDAIIPCGLKGVEITSVERETGQPATVEDAARRVAGTFWETFVVKEAT